MFSPADQYQRDLRRSERELERTQLGRNVHIRRVALGLTTRELAARSNLSHGRISEIERGERGVDAFTLRDLAHALETTADALLAAEDAS